MKFGERSLKSLQGVHPDLVQVLTEAIKETSIDFTVTGGVRTTAEQQALYAQGRTKPGTIVTYVDGVKKKSNHQPKSDGYGYAVDLYPYVGGSVRVSDVENLRVIAKHILETAQKLGVNIEWGGNWKMKDYPHFELKK